MARYTESQVEQAVQMYQDGAKTDRITEETGVPRASLYWHLNQRGLTPKRQPSARRGPKSKPKPGDSEPFEWAMKRIEEQAAEIAELKAELAQVNGT